ncbi:MAG: hypothetical protein QXD23_00730 [Candidatus Micrarchaeaceae archaeon]
MNSILNKFRITAFFFILTTCLSMVTVFAQQGIGTSKIIINPTTASVKQGNSTSLNYTVSLVTGNVWGTMIGVNNQSLLASEGITVIFSNNNQDPNFSGVATIKTENTTKPRTYQIEFVATGDDPTTTPTNFVLIVNGKTSVINTNTTTTNVNQTNKTNIVKTVNTTTVSTTNYVTTKQYTSNSTTNINQNEMNDYPTYISILAVIILFAVIIIRLKTI